MFCIFPILPVSLLHQIWSIYMIIIWDDWFHSCLIHFLINGSIGWFKVLEYVLILPYFVQYTTYLYDSIKWEIINTHGIRRKGSLVRSKEDIVGFFSLIDKNFPGFFQGFHRIIFGNTWIIIDLNQIGKYEIPLTNLHIISVGYRVHTIEVNVVPFMGNSVCSFQYCHVHK